MEQSAVQYWLFQIKPRQFRLREALRAEHLRSAEVQSHKNAIKKGDKVIIWQTEPEAGCYALATVMSNPAPEAIPEEELPYYIDLPEEDNFRVALSIDFNLWNRPVTPEVIPSIPAFSNFNAGLPGVNYRATKAQYEGLKALVKTLDLAYEPEIEYELPPWNDPPLNLILYGPPGTGKTYQTVNHALSIIENRSMEELAVEDRLELRRRFNEYQNTGQIAFISFHPSFAYEDFVEGIKAYTANGQVFYAVEDGIFKLMSGEARRCLLEALYQEQPVQQQQIAFDQLYQAFLEYLDSDTFNHFEAQSGKRIFLHRILRFGNLSVRRATGFSVSTIQKSALAKLYGTFAMPQQVEQLDQVRTLVGKGDAGAYFAVFKSLKAFEQNYAAQVEANSKPEVQEDSLPVFEVPLISRQTLARCRKYVLIIDEINRGNLSAIFGELISLLEPDKREGRLEALTAVLPYSKQYFGVPPNLYVIGTMNSTDRTAEALDLALRRRFRFEHMQSDAALLRGRMIGQIELSQLLATINHRLAFLLGPDYAVGHAYFLEVETFADLCRIFETAILPLLETYFTNDYAKIGLIMGQDFIEEVASDDNENSLFANFDHPYADNYFGQKRYQFRASESWTEGSFVRVYNRDFGH